MTAIQQLLDYIEQLKRLEAVYTLESWLAEHSRLVIAIIAVIVILTYLVEHDKKE